MRILSSFILALLLCSFGSAERHETPVLKKARVCDPKIKVPNLEKLQKQAFADYVDLWVTKRDVLTAYNRYVPG